MRNQRLARSVSTHVAYDCSLRDPFLNLPTVTGAVRESTIPLEAKEQQRLRRSAELLRGALAETNHVAGSADHGKRL